MRATVLSSFTTRASDTDPLLGCRGRLERFCLTLVLPVLSSVPSNEQNKYLGYSKHRRELRVLNPHNTVLVKLSSLRDNRCGV